MLAFSEKNTPNIKWLGLGWVISDLPLKRLGADALCQLMFRVMPVSLKDSLMRPRQARCARSSRAEKSESRPRHASAGAWFRKKEKWKEKEKKRKEIKTLKCCKATAWGPVREGEMILCEMAVKSLDLTYFFEMVKQSCEAVHRSNFFFSFKGSGGWGWLYKAQHDFSCKTFGSDLSSKSPT